MSSLFFFCYGLRSKTWIPKQEVYAGSLSVYTFPVVNNKVEGGHKSGGTKFATQGCPLIGIPLYTQWMYRVHTPMSASFIPRPSPSFSSLTAQNFCSCMGESGNKAI